jgi:hypothetical protein
VILNRQQSDIRVQCRRACCDPALAAIATLLTCCFTGCTHTPQSSIGRVVKAADVAPSIADRMREAETQFFKSIREAREENRSITLAPRARASLARSHHNLQAATLSDLWCRADITVTYRNKGRERASSVFEGHVIYRDPNRFSFRLSKLGEAVFWAGSNEQVVWWFDDSTKTASIIRPENIGHPLADDPPIPFHPVLLRALIGLQPMPPLAHTVPSDGMPTSPPRNRSIALLQSPQDLLAFHSTGEGVRWITFMNEMDQPVGVAIADGEDWSVAPTAHGISLFGGQFAVDNKSAITVPKWVFIASSSEDGGIAILVKDLSETPPNGKRIDDSVFDFFAMREILRPQHIVILDSRCPKPAALMAN